MRRTITYLSLSLFSLCLLFSHVSLAAGPTYISYSVDSSDPWTKENSPYIVQNHVVVNVPLTIEAGTVVKFKNSLADLNIKKDFYVNGTREEPVVFTSIHDDSDGNNSDNSSQNPQIGDWSSVMLNPFQDYEIKIKYAKIFYAGMGVSFYPSTGQTKEISLKYSEIKKNGIGIVGVNSDALIEKNIISENAHYGISVNASTKTTKAINNSIANNGIGVRGVNNVNPDKIVLDARYNWWGDKSGPQNENNPDGEGNSIAGLVLFDPWLKEDPITFPDPVIIIPGIMGSWEKDGVWQIDPIFHIYDNLYEEFRNEGYVPEKDLFTFPYQWRDSNKVNAVELRAKIQEIKNETNRPKVDIVAHSMGGLLAREYIESSYYEDDVDQLITVGTPHLGAPEAYMKWEGGAWLYNFYELAQKSFVDHEARENGFDDAYDYIRNRPITSLKELLPSYNYLFDVDNNYLPRNSYPINYPQNTFLDNLSGENNIAALEDVEFTKIVGNTNEKESTIAGYNVVDSNIDNFWEYGIPKDFYNPLFTENGLVYSEGDETVPLYSAKAVDTPSDKTIYIESKHNSLPTDAQKDILEILSGKQPTNEMRKWHVPSILIIFVHCPVDIQIESPSGQKIGKKFETNGIYDEIEGAYYTGFDTNSEFITIPNPEEGEYKILAQGMGEGEYKIETTKITENSNDPDNAKESSVTIEGETQMDEIQESEIEIAGDQVIYNPDTTPPTISISSPEEKDYTNDKILTIDYKAEDLESGIASDSWQVEKDGQNLGWQEKSIDLSLEHLGDYTLKISATDKADNFSSKETKFRVVTNLNAIQENIGHYWDLDLIKKKSVKTYLDHRLKDLENLFNLLERTKNSKLRPEIKQLAIEILETVIRVDINRIIRLINSEFAPRIDSKTADLLVEDLNYIKNF